jgi:predicted MFS family arabinose efflux permease
LTTLWSIKTFRLINFAAVAAAIAVYGFIVWTPIYIIRRSGLTTGEVGTAIGLIAGIAGSTGVFLGGFLADRFSKNDQRWQLRIPALTTLMFSPLILLVINAGSAKAAMVLLVPAYALALAYTGPTWAVLATSTPAIDGCRYIAVSRQPNWTWHGPPTHWNR